MSQKKPDLETARQMLAREKRRQRIRRRFLWILAILAAGLIIAIAVLQTDLFKDVYRQLIVDLGLV